eukprot:scaffold326146_cov73-Tisochrysis_lutea.AAC.2
MLRTRGVEVIAGSTLTSVGRCRVVSADSHLADSRTSDGTEQRLLGLRLPEPSIQGARKEWTAPFLRVGALKWRGGVMAWKSAHDICGLFDADGASDLMCSEGGGMSAQSC